MPKTSTFTIYNASAGSGKTYTLVKAYLKLLLQSSNRYHFKRILAITFTNKAVAEMKTRVIDTLKTFSDKNTINESNSMFDSICEELNIEPEALQKKSAMLLETIIHNYAAFDISTIDGFTHKLIRTFAHDLKLPVNFEVELDQDALLNEAVNSLISKTGTNDALTKTLVEFALEKADNDKSWDVSFDFNKIAKLLINENDKPFVDSLKDKTLTDFETLKQQLKKEIVITEKQIIDHAKRILTLIEEAGLEHTDFSRSTLPNHFKKVSQLHLNKIYDNKLEENISNRTGIYNKSLAPELASVIEQLLPEIETQYKFIKSQVYHLKFIKAFYKNITPLSVLNAINHELVKLKEDQNKILISEFNAIISNQIKAQPTPFIYERIGERFKHYFIDEFQDTSIMQWENLIPLVENTLSAEDGSTMLVGDAKQAIYRWRGGKAEQFIDLFKKNKAFHTKIQVEHLPSNFRSFKEIVTFNNDFFEYLGNQVFSLDDYQSLYLNGRQNITKNHDGYVELNFLEYSRDDDKNEIFPSVVLEKIQDCIAQGYHLEDICILVRKKREGVVIANYLSLNGIQIISSETLLLNNSPEVVFINDLLALLNQPKHDEIRIRVLNYLAQLFNITDKHHFFTTHITLNIPDLFRSFKNYGVTITGEQLLQLPLYDLAETLIRQFNLIEGSNAYIQFYLDVVFEFTEKKGSDISGFLDFFEKKKDTLSIVSPEGQNAIQIMTIHKSKGLEFPVVIFPYADLDIYNELEPKVWFKINQEKYNGFSYTLLHYNQDLEHFGEEGQKLFKKHQSELELDNINLLYVALTRPIEQLYVICTKAISTKGEASLKTYSGLLINYLKQKHLWNDTELIYKFGTPKKPSKEVLKKRKPIVQEHEFVSTPKEDHNIKIVTKSGYLWNTNQEEAIEKGNLIHNLMSHVVTGNDIESTIADFNTSSKINKHQSKFLKETMLRIVNHPQLSQYFGSKYKAYNEHDIISENGMVLRPDRVVINPNGEAVIIDYKTGLEDKKHSQQLQSYQDALEAMKINVKKKILIYINDDIKVKDV